MFSSDDGLGELVRVSHRLCKRAIPINQSTSRASSPETSQNGPTTTTHLAHLNTHKHSDFSAALRGLLKDREGSLGYDLYTWWRREVRSAGLLVRLALGLELEASIKQVDAELEYPLVHRPDRSKKAAKHTTSCDHQRHILTHYSKRTHRDGKMSNQTVGAVYQQIIRDVVDSSRVDFEEGGVDESVLDELSRVWQQKLTALSVAQFPWDPKPEPPPPQQMASIPSSMPYPQDSTPAPMQQQQHAPPHQGQYMNRPGPQAPTQAPQFPQMPQMPQMNAGPRIKAEPGLETGAMPPVYTGMQNATTAQQRAALNLQASYGARAAASINAIQGMPQQGQQQQPQQQQQGQPQQQGQQPQQGQQQQQQPNQQQSQQQAQQQQQQMHQAQQRPQGQSIPRPQMTPSQYQQALAQQAAHQKQQLEAQAKARQQASAAQQGQSAPNGAQNAQTDGGADEDEDRHAHFGVIKQVGVDGSEINMGRVELDGLIRRQIEARGKAMEGGGLMLPLKAQKGSSGGARRERKRAADVGQTDGGDDDDDDDEKVLKEEDDDEDAINSDLDDPDDPKSDDSGDDETPQVMLCMYDKVQRVKNKWKCVMKDGVLTINGKDYVFHKASGEYEW
ncbi:hypothetical protein O988_05931 [Pseudogymnoascus sp. VKM F-3808]|nr:hypothetical protein O988_05931 [Pseudogymnoascus sp. VKM F-3808]